MLHNRILQESQRLAQKIKSLQSDLKHFPDGQLVCCHQRSGWKWYHSDGHTKSYIPKTNRSYAEKLAIKKYLETTLSELTQEQDALQAYLKKHQTSSLKSQKLLNEIPAYKELLAPYFKSDSQELNEWMLASYETNSHYPEHLIHKTASGRLVRSKSEAIIDMILYSNNIPFRYECALYLEDYPIYPDFTIRHPATGETYYWEHFGIMDDPAYAQNAFSKLQLYNSHNIIPSIQLITTYETKEHPLSIEMIQKIVEYYFL